MPLTGSGAGTTPPLAIDTRFMTCTNGVCDVAPAAACSSTTSSATGFLASGGHSPVHVVRRRAGGLTLRPSGLVVRFADGTGTSTFNVTVTDARRVDRDRHVLADGHQPAGADSCPAARPAASSERALSGPAFNGRTPSGSATADMTKFSGCGGFSTLSVSVSNVNLPDGTQLWVTLDFGAVGTITSARRSGAMALYNMGRFGVSRDAVRVYSALPDVSASVQILIGGSFQ